MAYLFMGTVIDLIHYTGVVVWMFHFLVAIALFILRRRWRDIKRPYKVDATGYLDLVSHSPDCNLNLCLQGHS